MTAQDWLTHARLLEDMIASEAIQLCMRPGSFQQVSVADDEAVRTVLLAVCPQGGGVHGVVDGTSMAASGFSPSGRRCSPVFFLAFWITVASR